MRRANSIILAPLVMAAAIGVSSSAFAQSGGDGTGLGHINGARLPPGVGGLRNRLPAPTMSQPGPVTPPNSNATPSNATAAMANAMIPSGNLGTLYGNIQAGPAPNGGDTGVLGPPPNNVGSTGTVATISPGSGMRADFATPALGVSELTRRLQKTLSAASSLPSGSTIQVGMAGTSIVLRGKVGDEGQKRLAEALIRLEPGVNGVRNELQIGSE